MSSNRRRRGDDGASADNAGDEDDGASADNAGDEDDGASADNAGDEDDGASDQDETTTDLFLRILRLYKVEYVYRLSVPQMVTLALKLIKSNQARDLRPAHVQSMIDAYNTDHPDDDDYHDQEYNELACIMDYLIKLKANIMGLYRLLRDGDERIHIFSFPNKDFPLPNDMPDVFVKIPEELPYEICQGASYRLFGDYRLFDGHIKSFPEGRYMAGLFSARVIDTNAKQASQDGVPLGDNDTQHGADGTEHRVIRQIVSFPNSVEDPAHLINLDDPTRTRNQDSTRSRDHTLRLHRLILILASYLEITVFDEGVLQEMGLRIPDGCTFEDYVTYWPLTNRDERKRILRALRVGKAHSLTCDGDHRLGYFFMWCHGLAYCKELSHRLNQCFVHVRRNAGHWCLGLCYSRYTGGVETNEIDTSFVERITWEEEGEALFDEEEIEETNLFDVLPRRANWIINVDCTCSSNGGERCGACVAAANDNASDESEEE